MTTRDERMAKRRIADGRFRVQGELLEKAFKTKRKQDAIIATTKYVGPLKWHDKLYAAKWTPENHLVYPFAANPVLAALLLAFNRVKAMPITGSDILEETFQNIRLYPAVAYVETDNYVGFVASKNADPFGLANTQYYSAGPGHTIQGPATIWMPVNAGTSSKFVGFVSGNTAIGTYTSCLMGLADVEYTGTLTIVEPLFKYRVEASTRVPCWSFQLNGYGTCKYSLIAEPDYYVGWFRNNKRNGYGILRNQYDMKVRYMGNWKDDKFHGKGILLLVNWYTSDVYMQCNFTDGKPDMDPMNLHEDLYDENGPFDHNKLSRVFFHHN